MKYIFYLSIIFTSIFFSCRSSRTAKHINKAIAPKDTLTAFINQSSADSLILLNKTLSNLQKNFISFKTFSAKAKVEIEDSKGRQPDITAAIRIIKDSVIWISLTATFLNIEVFRMYITKDSVILLNKQNKEVQYRSLDYLQDVTEIPFDFITVQNLIIGNPVFFNNEKVSIRKFENFILLSTLSKDFKNLLTLSRDNNFLLHSKLDDLDIARNRTADFTYDDYVNSNGFNFSTTRQIVAAEKNRTNIQMNFKQFEFNKELSVPFSVPKNYKKK